MSRLFRTAATFLLAAAWSAAAEPATPPEPLRTAAAVRALSSTAAETHPEVVLRGVVTFAWHAEHTAFTLQDATGAIWLPPMDLPVDCGVGVEVEVRGHAERGAAGPFVRASGVRPLGPGTLPKPKVAGYEDLLSAEWHGQRVEVLGVIRGQRTNPEFGLGWLALEVATGGGRVTVNVTHESTGQPELVDARVRVRGVYLHSQDAQQQAFLPAINAHTLPDIEVLEPGTQHPFALAPVPLGELMRTAGPAGPGHRVHVRGAVTILRPGNSFFLQDDSRGMQIFLRESAAPDAGDVVDVVGFPEPGAYSPVLRDADWRPTGQKLEPPATPMSAAAATRHDGRLLHVQGKLSAVEIGGRETLLTLDAEERRFIARVPGGTSDRWQVGSSLGVTGVCAVDVGSWEALVTHREPQGFTLLAREAGDVQVVKAAPWWTPTRLAWLLAALGLALLALLGAVWGRGRGRLREAARTRQAAQVEFSAILGERTRLAREIHDTLAQGFAGVSMQLEVLNDRLASAVAPDTLRHLNVARELVRTSLVESRRTVWNLRSQTLEEHGLAASLERLGGQLAAGSALQFAFRLEGVPRSLPPDIENNLLRIGQEALTNAVRHADARQMTLTLAFLESRERLVIQDDGKGFDPAISTPSHEGGFGLAGIRERAAEMGADLRVESRPGAGTTIEITIFHV